MGQLDVGEIEDLPLSQLARRPPGTNGPTSSSFFLNGGLLGTPEHLATAESGGRRRSRQSFGCLTVESRHRPYGTVEWACCGMG